MQASGHSDGIPEARAALGALDARLLQGARKALAAGLLLIASRAQSAYLSGPRPAVLGVVSGRLRGSIATQITDTPTALVGAVGTAVPYAAYHEFGFHGTEQVRAHARIVGLEILGKAINLRDARGPQRDSRTGKVVGYKRSSRRAVDEALRLHPGAKVAVQQVKAYTRKVDYAGRPFLRPALRDIEPQLLARIQAELTSLAP